jgi:hypothetical protein
MVSLVAFKKIFSKMKEIDNNEKRVDAKNNCDANN